MVRSLCNKGVMLRHGQVDFKGGIGEVLDHYEQTIDSKFGNNAYVEFTRETQHMANIVSASISDDAGTPTTVYDVFDAVNLEVRYEVNEPAEGIVISVILERNGEPLFYSQDTDVHPDRFGKRMPGMYTTKVRLLNPLKAGRYVIHISVSRSNAKPIERHSDAFVFDVIEKSFDPSMKSYYSKRIGVIATELDWQITNFEPQAILDRK
jgi:hypothetical protein